MQLLAHVLGLRLGLGFFIRPFIVRHMAAQQLLDLVANATAGPCLGLGLGLGFSIIHVKHVLGLGFRVRV
jgi:hypothetical protein